MQQQHTQASRGGSDADNAGRNESMWFAPILYWSLFLLLAALGLAIGKQILSRLK